MGGLFTRRPQKATIGGRRRSLRVEPLEGRNLLSVSMLGTISGVCYYDPSGGSLTASDTRLSGVTVELFNAGANTPIATTTTNASGAYSFTGLSAATYNVEQMPAAGYVLGSGQNISTITISNSDLGGTVGTVIDSFSSTTQTANAAYPGSTTGNSYSSATEAIGGGRDMSVQLTSAHGSVTLGADSTTPDALDYTSSPGAVGTASVIWQGQATGDYATAPGMLRNPEGLNNLDLTSGGAATGFELTLGGDRGISAALKVYTDANDWSSATVAIPDTSDATASQTVFVPFSSFTAGAGTGASFSNVGAIELDISGPAAADGQVGSVETVGPTVYTHNFDNSVQTDLAIVKTATPSPAVAGTQLTYTLTATNDGPSNATGVTVSDTMPAGVTFVSATPSQGDGTFSNDVLTMNVGNLADGATATITVLVDVGTSTRGTIINTATITGNEPDPNLANNTSTVQTPVIAETDVAIVKTATPSPVPAGTQLTYTLTTTNNGPSDATGVTVSDTMPAGVTFVSATPSQGTDSFTNGVLTVDLGNLADGATATTTVLVNVGTSTRGTIVNTATVTENETDTNLANNTSTVQTPVIAETDVAIVKTATPSPATAGTQLTYTLTTTNNGPADATGVTVSDTMPAGVTFVSATPSQGSDTFANGVLTVNLGDLADGATATTTVLVNVGTSTRGTITNTATVTENETDTNLTNNTSTVQTPVNASVDLAIVKTATPNPVDAGKPLTYTLTATNDGPSDGTGVTVVDTLPAGVTYASSTTSQGTVSASGSTVTVSLGNLAYGANATTTIIVDVGSTTTGDITNTATISGNEPDPNMSNNTSSVTTFVDQPNHPLTIPQSDLAIVKLAPATVYSGNTLTYTLNVTNWGGSDDTGVIVTDALPAGETLVSVSSSQGSTSVSKGTITATLGDMADLGTASVTIVVRVTAKVGSTLINTANVTGDVDDPTLTNNQSTVSTNVLGLPSKRNYLT
jgi:uncharacterized repeat protein (TIGR01451 family)